MECYLGRYALLFQHKCLNDSDDKNYDNDSGGIYDYDNDDDDNDDDYIYCFVVIYLDISNYNTFSENCVLYKKKGE